MVRAAARGRSRAGRVCAGPRGSGRVCASRPAGAACMQYRICCRVGTYCRRNCRRARAHRAEIRSLVPGTQRPTMPRGVAGSSPPRRKRRCCFPAAPSSGKGPSSANHRGGGCTLLASACAGAGRRTGELMRAAKGRSKGGPGARFGAGGSRRRVQEAASPTPGRETGGRPCWSTS